MNILEVRGRAGDTFSEVSTNDVQDLDTGTALAFKDSEGRLITALLIQIQDDDLRFCFGSDPVVGGLGMDLVVSQTLYLENPANIRAFKYISNIVGAPATMMITPFYGNR